MIPCSYPAPAPSRFLLTEFTRLAGRVNSGNKRAGASPPLPA
jgi:hypothetical protein